MQEKGKRNSCYQCREISHTFMQCRERNRSSRGGATAQEKAYKVGCALSVKKLNAAEIDKPEQNVKR